MIDRILAKRIVPVVVLDRAESAEPLAEALLAGGLDIMEITFRTAAAEESIERIAARFPEILLGAGTLLEKDQVRRAKDAGAVFGLAPGLNPNIIAATKETGLQFSPGVMTPSDVELALSLGCKLLKFFPAEAAGGVNMLKALAGPYAHTGVKFIPTGGVSSGNLADYLKLPVVAAIGGSWMVDKQLVNDGKWSEITRITREALPLRRLSDNNPAMITGIELGGTKTVVAIGSADGRIIEECRFPTTLPEETLGIAIDWLRARGQPSSIGIAAFGPIGIVRNRENYGSVLSTPKPGWAGFSLTDTLSGAFPNATLTLDTDVNAAALAEAKIGAAAGLEDVVYITIGTGIGGGILSGGRLIHGALHPEFGHLKVPRMLGDDFPGVCPFHGDCLEGLASGPAIAARWGSPAHELPADHPAWETQAWYLAHGILALLAIVSPARVIVGGGVSQAEGLHRKINGRLREIAAGYFPQALDPNYVVPPALGQEAGIRGAFLLAAGIASLADAP